MWTASSCVYVLEVKVSIPFRWTHHVVFDSDIGGDYLNEGHKDETNMKCT